MKKILGHFNVPMKPLDIPVITLAVILTFFIGSSARQTSASRVVVKGQDKTWIFPLEAEELVTVTGSIGETVVEVHNGKTAIISSPCSGQTCVAAGKLHKNGQWTACLPNRVFILIEGTKGRDVDAASY